MGRVVNRLVNPLLVLGGVGAKFGTVLVLLLADEFADVAVSSVVPVVPSVLVLAEEATKLVLALALRLALVLVPVIVAVVLTWRLRCAVLSRCGCE